MKKFFYGMLTMYFANRIGRWWTPVFLQVITKTPAKDKSVLGRNVRSTARRYGYPPTDYSDRFKSPTAETTTHASYPPPRLVSNIYGFKLSSAEVADELLDEMRDLVARYNQVYVADVMALLGKTPGYNDSLYGWTDIDGIKTVREKYKTEVYLTGPSPVRL